MKLAAVKALAAMAKEPVPDIVTLAYNQNNDLWSRLYYS
jgi:malate dehydrogenase (oxaloacetate-decarboxylating)(NADP+)